MGGTIHPTVLARLPQLAELCRQYHVARLELFGSAATDGFDPARSDLDFLVQYLPEPGVDPLEEFFGFKAALEQLFGRKVDLVEPGGIRNPRFRQELEVTKLPLYAA